ncbi:sulfite exporter TauE/SafE family protein [Candidatus Latescibacterota bacterium]
MPDYHVLIVSLIAVLSFFVKGATGFGNALIMVPLLSVMVGVRHAIVVASILDILAGAILFHKTASFKNKAFWLPMAAAMIAGSITGGIALRFVPVQGFEFVFGTVTMVLGAWFIMGRGGKDESTLPTVTPKTCRPADAAVSALAGLCGGLIGITGPPIVYYLGSRLAKAVFRSTLIALFLFSSTARVATYSVMGLVDTTVLVLAMISIPGTLLGIWLGNHLFIRIREVWFSRLAGAVLIISALRIMMG